MRKYRLMKWMLLKNIFGEKYRFEFKNFILLKIESKQKGTIYALIRYYLIK